MIKRLKRKAIEPFASCLFKRYFGKYPSQGKFSVCLSFDVDYKEDVDALPELLELLNKYEVKASFACVGMFIELYPKEHKLILENGHEIINHTYSHPDNEILSPNRFFNEMSYAEQKEEVERCDEVCKRILNYSPTGFRTPHFGRLHCESVYKILKELNYKYSSSTILTRTKHTGPFLTKGIWEIPIMTCPDHYFPIFDSWHCYRSTEPAHKKLGEFHRLFKGAITLCKENNATCVIYLDPQDAVKYKEDFEASLTWLKAQNIPLKNCEELI